MNHPLGDPGKGWAGFLGRIVFHQANVFSSRPNHCRSAFFRRRLTARHLTTQQVLLEFEKLAREATEGEVDQMPVASVEVRHVGGNERRARPGVGRVRKRRKCRE
jgi:hypothetical protein